jgi:hypothetical protein
MSFIRPDSTELFYKALDVLAAKWRPYDYPELRNANLIPREPIAFTVPRTSTPPSPLLTTLYIYAQRNCKCEACRAFNVEHDSGDEDEASR